MAHIEIKIIDDKIAVTAPFSTSFVRRAKLLGGQWNSASGTWDFPAEVEKRVREKLLAVYGEDGSLCEHVTLRVKFPDGWCRTHGPVEFADRSICHAWGRDSGAKVSEGVAIVEGSCTSGGSVKNWTTVLKAGSVVEIHNVALRKALEYAEDPLVEILFAGDVDRATLEAERASLLARIAEIDYLLKQENG